MTSGHRGFPTVGQGMAVVLITIGSYLAAGFAVFFLTVGLKEKNQDTVALFSGLLGACVAAVLVLVWASAVRRESLRLLAVPKPVAPVPLVLAVVATLGADVVLSQIDNWLRWLIPPGPSFREMMSSLERGSLPLVIASAVVVGPVCEELIFRGVLVRGFLENYRPRAAILLSSLLFAFLHLNPYQGMTSFFVGCLFAWFVARTGSLLPAIAGHVLSNGLAAVASRSHAGIPGFTTEGFQPWWLTALGVLVTAGGIAAFHRATRAAWNSRTGELVAS